MKLKGVETEGEVDVECEFEGKCGHVVGCEVEVEGEAAWP